MGTGITSRRNDFLHHQTPKFDERSTQDFIMFHLLSADDRIMEHKTSESICRLQCLQRTEMNIESCRVPVLF